MTKRQDLCLQRRSRPEQSDQRQPDQAVNISHQPRASPDSTSLASRIEFPTMTTGHWTNMHQSLVKFSESEASNHTPSLADFTTITPELKFSVHTSDTLMRCRTSQRRFRNTLLFVAPDESLLGTARDVMRKAQAWAGSCHLLTLHAWPRAEVAV